MATKKRGHGEGSVFQRQDGKWVAKASLGHDIVTGKRLRATYYGATRAEAAKKLTEALRAHQKGQTVSRSDQQLGTFLSHWLETVIKPGRRASTYRSYEQIVRNHLVPGLGRIPLNKLTPQTLQEFINRKAEDGVSADHLRRVLRSALSQAMKFELVGRNVASLVSIPKRETKTQNWLTSDEIHRLMAAAKNRDLEMFVVLASWTGLRLGELLALRWEDVDITQGAIFVRQQVSFATGRAEFTPTKTAHSRRAIPVPAFVVKALQAHRSKQTSQINPLGLVLPSRTGTPMDARNVRRAFASIVQESGLPPMRVHDLRHSAATMMKEAGAELEDIKAMLGHSQLAITANLYTHVSQKVKRGVADRLQALYETSSSQ